MRKEYLILAVLLFVTYFFAGAQSIVYVSPDGNDSNSGAIDAPFATVKKAISNIPDGSTIYLRAGVYREQINITRKNIKLFAYNNEKAIIKGSKVMTGWQSHGSFYKKYVDIQPQQVFVNGNHPLQQIGMPSKYIVNDATKRYASPVGKGIGDMAPGRFWWQDDTLYIWLDDSSDPNASAIEVSQNRYVIRTSNGSHIKGIQFEHSNANTFTEQGSAVELNFDCILESCVVQWCDFSGVSMGKSAVMVDCEILYNGSVGTSSISDGFVIRNTRFAYNNYRNFFSQWHAGGFKAASQSWGTIENCELDNNNGSGVWFDYCHKALYLDDDGFYPIIVRNNYFHGNGTNSYDYDTLANMPSILIEVSHQAYVYNNIIDTFQYGGIKLSSATDGYYVNNVLMNGEAGGYYVLDGGASYVSWAWVRNNVIANNILYNNKLINQIRMQPDDGGIKYYNNICRNNLIYKSSGSIRFLYGSAKKRGLDAWQKDTPFGEGSISEEPSFVANTYKLADNSPCINTGYDVLNEIITEDYIGNSRKLGPFTDMGVFEEIIGGTDEYNAVLQNLEVDLGTLEPVFDETSFIYTDTLPDDTKQIPVVTATPYNSGSVVTITDATNVQATDEADRTTTVVVTSESGVIEYTYKIIFYSKNTTGIDDVANSNFRLYPNPSNGIIYIENNDFNSDVRIDILNIQGRVVKTEQFDVLSGKTKIDLSDQPAGLYLMSVKSHEINKVVKFYIQ